MLFSSAMVRLFFELTNKIVTFCRYIVVFVRFFVTLRLLPEQTPTKQELMVTKDVKEKKGGQERRSKDKCKCDMKTCECEMRKVVFC